MAGNDAVFNLGVNDKLTVTVKRAAGALDDLAKSSKKTESSMNFLSKAGQFLALKEVGQLAWGAAKALLEVHGRTLDAQRAMARFGSEGKGAIKWAREFGASTRLGADQAAESMERFSNIFGSVAEGKKLTQLVGDIQAIGGNAEGATDKIAELGKKLTAGKGEAEGIVEALKVTNYAEFTKAMADVSGKKVETVQAMLEKGTAQNRWLVGAAAKIVQMRRAESGKVGEMLGGAAEAVGKSDARTPFAQMSEDLRSLTEKIAEGIFTEGFMKDLGEFRGLFKDLTQGDAANATITAFSVAARGLLDAGKFWLETYNKYVNGSPERDREAAQEADERRKDAQDKEAANAYKAANNSSLNVGSLRMLRDLGLIDFQAPEGGSVQAHALKKWQDAGSTNMDSYIKGVLGKTDDVADAHQKVQEAGQKAAADADQRKSPSKIYMQAGKDNVRGYVIGLKDAAADPVNRKVFRTLGGALGVTGLSSGPKADGLPFVLSIQPKGPQKKTWFGTVPGGPMSHAPGTPGGLLSQSQAELEELQRAARGDFQQQKQNMVVVQGGGGLRINGGIHVTVNASGDPNAIGSAAAAAIRGELERLALRASLMGA